MIAISDRLKIVFWYILFFVVTFFVIQFLIFFHDGNDYYKETSFLIMIGLDIANAFISGFLTLSFIQLPHSGPQNEVIDLSENKINYLAFSIRCLLMYSIINIVLAVVCTFAVGNLFVPDMKIDILSSFIYGLKECYRAGALFTFVTVIFLINKFK